MQDGVPVGTQSEFVKLPECICSLADPSPSYLSASIHALFLPQAEHWGAQIGEIVEWCAFGRVICGHNLNLHGDKLDAVRQFHHE